VEAQIAIDPLIKALHDEDSIVRINAVRALGRIGPNEKAVIDALIGALKDIEPLVRENVARALEVVKPEGKVFTALIETLKDKNQNVSISAAGALGNISFALQDSKETKE